MAYDLRNLKFLLVDDNPAMIAILRSVLRSLGVQELRHAANGEGAVEILRLFKPDIVITDFQMQPMSGTEFTRWLRRDRQSPSPYVGIIMTSAYSELRRVQEARDAGVTEFLVKPITPRNLYDRIAAVIDNPRPFIRCATYVGPCRRRKSDPAYIGPMRRASDRLRGRKGITDEVIDTM